MNKKLPQFFIAALASLATVCGAPASAQSAVADFACRISQKQGKVGQNTLLSPLSLYLALAMTANGAGGETRKSMARLLGASPDGNLVDFNKQNGELLARLNASESVRISLNNAIFADIASPVEGDFIKLCQTDYGAVVQNADFASHATVSTINKWCFEKTEGKIASIIDRIKPGEKMILLNTVYFKGAWQTAFNPSRTEPGPFYFSGQASKNVAMMHGSLDARHLKTAEFDALALPYKGGRQHLYVFMPADKTKDPKALAEALSGAKWLSWSRSFENCRAQVTLPKCKFTFAADLGDTLKEMGIASAFGEQADFTKMFGARSGCIGRVLQKTFIDIEENGTEAAAATAVAMMPRGMRMPEAEIPFVVDRPFVLGIVDDESRQFLFLGAVYQPD